MDLQSTCYQSNPNRYFQEQLRDTNHWNSWIERTSLYLNLYPMEVEFFVGNQQEGLQQEQGIIYSWINDIICFIIV